MKRELLIVPFLALIICLLTVNVLAVDKTVVNWAVGGSIIKMARELAVMYTEEHPDIEIKILEVPASSTERLNLYLQFFEAESDKVDIYTIDLIWPGMLAEHLVDLNQYGGSQVARAHFPAIVENNTVDGRLLAMPWYTDAGLLYYRTDLLEKYGYNKPPENWDQLEEMASRIQEGERGAGKEDFWGYVWQGNVYEGLTCNALEWIASHGGGTIIEDRKITVYNPRAIAAIERAAGWIGRISPPAVTGFIEEPSRPLWQSGHAAFMRNWPYCYRLGNAAESVIKGKFDVVPLPAGEGGQRVAALGGWQLALSSYSNNIAAAADVALFMTSEQAQKYNALQASYNPTIKALYQDQELISANPFYAKLYDVFINAVARPSTVTAPNYNQVSNLFYHAVHAVLTGEEESRQALGYLQFDLQQVTGLEIVTEQ